jgi:DNA-binding HxlR family transcriptional regulator
MGDTHKPVRTAHDKGECRAVTEFLARIGDKWTVMVVGALSQGTRRYTELHRSVDGISQRMLTLTLKGLEEDGLVVRTVYPTIPPRVEYALTDLGRTLIRPLRTLREWTVEHRPAMLEARKAYAKAAASSFSKNTLVSIASGAIDAYAPNISQRRKPARS